MNSTVMTIIVIVSMFLTFIAAAILMGKGTYRTCVSGHYERYYDSSGTALWIATKNPGFISQNGYRTRFVCDKFK